MFRSSKIRSVAVLRHLCEALKAGRGLGHLEGSDQQLRKKISRNLLVVNHDDPRPCARGHGASGLALSPVLPWEFHGKLRAHRRRTRHLDGAAEQLGESLAKREARARCPLLAFVAGSESARTLRRYVSGIRERSRFPCRTPGTRPYRPPHCDGPPGVPRRVP